MKHKFPQNAPKRYCDFDFPPYRYIPGESAHPTRDPQGHSYGHEHDALDFIDPRDWKTNSEYLFGVDLYNAAFWWESHEAWENVWHTTNKDSDYGQFLQGLIQISAAFIKWQVKGEEGMTRLYEIGRKRLQSVAKQNPKFMGLDLVSHLKSLDEHFQLVLSQGDLNLDPLQDYPFITLSF